VQNGVSTLNNGSRTQTTAKTRETEGRKEGRETNRRKEEQGKTNKLKEERGTGKKQKA
jgi:hypothetical protein